MMLFVIANISTQCVSIFSVMFDVVISHNHGIGLLHFLCLTTCLHSTQSLAIVLNASLDGSRFCISSLGKLMASQQVFIAISRICIIGLGLLGVLPIGTTTTNTNQVVD